MSYQPKPAERVLLQALQPDQLKAVVGWLNECSHDLYAQPATSVAIRQLAARCHSVSLAAVALTVLLDDTGELTAIERCPGRVGDLFYSIRLPAGQSQDEFLTWLYPEGGQTLLRQRNLNDTLRELADHRTHTMTMLYSFWLGYDPQPTK